MVEKSKGAKSKSSASAISNRKMLAGRYDKHSTELAFVSQDADALRGVTSRMEALNIKQEPENSSCKDNQRNEKAR
jgi:hypothetical protein